MKKLIWLDDDYISIPNRNFSMAKTPVTQKQWKEVMGSNPSYFKGRSRPVEQVSWNDVQEFLKRLNKSQNEYIYSLPTITEWEYCCNACSSKKIENVTKVAVCYENSEYETKNVASKKSNEWGLYDMLGNVWEWTKSRYGSYRIISGGSWYNDGEILCSATRSRSVPDKRDFGVGFRLIRIKKRKKNGIK
jgi:formylglycine-generating enzyme required for sulfatase activity